MEPIIQTGDLVLRLWSPADKDTITDIAQTSQREFSGWLPGVMTDLADLDAFIAYVERAARDETGWYYAIEVAGTPVGQCSISKRDPGRAEIGYWVRTDHTNQGIATRAVRAVSEHAGQHGFHEIVIHCDEGNARSAAVARKAGFTHTGTETLDPTLPRTAVQTGREMTWRRSFTS